MTHADIRPPLGIALSVTGLLIVADSFIDGSVYHFVVGLMALTVGTVVLFDLISIPRDQEVADE